MANSEHQLGASISNNEQPVDDFLGQYDIVETCKWITDNNFLKVCLQFPDELLSESGKIYDEIKKRVDIDLYILDDPTYASCCVNSGAARQVEGNAVIHYGNSCFSKTNIPVFIVLPKKDLDVEDRFKLLKHLSFGGSLKICFFYDAEFDHCRDDIAKNWFLYCPQSYLAFVEKEDSPNRFFGRVIRNRQGQEFPIGFLKDCICILMGTRGHTLFHYTISIKARQWYSFNPDDGIFKHSEDTKWFSSHQLEVEKCKTAKKFGILLCNPPGDQTEDMITRIKDLCKRKGKRCFIVTVGKPNVENLAHFPEIHIYIMISCPENDFYSYGRQRGCLQPIVYPCEMDVALNSIRDQSGDSDGDDSDGLEYHFGMYDGCEVFGVEE